LISPFQSGNNGSLCDIPGDSRPDERQAGAAGQGTDKFIEEFNGGVVHGVFFEWYIAPRSWVIVLLQKTRKNRGYAAVVSRVYPAFLDTNAIASSAKRMGGSDCDCGLTVVPSQLP